MDYKTDPVLAKATAGRQHVLFGNIDPSGVLALGTVEQVRDASRRLIETWKPGGRFVLNAGCALPAMTPPDNIRALGRKAAFLPGVDENVASLASSCRPGDLVLIMSNGGFGGIQEKLAAALSE